MAFRLRWASRRVTAAALGRGRQLAKGYPMTGSAHLEKYPFTIIALHWMTLLLMAAAYVTMEFRDIFPRGSVPRDLMKSTHYVIGITILALVAVRIAARFMVRTPPITPPLPVWQKVTSRAVHLALFALMIVLPLLGWLILSAEGVPVSYFGLELPALIGVDKSLAEGFEEAHETIARIGYGLIGVHAAAALFHHYVVRDNTLARMLPLRPSA